LLSLAVRMPDGFFDPWIIHGHDQHDVTDSAGSFQRPAPFSGNTPDGGLSSSGFPDRATGKGISMRTTNFPTR